MCMCVGKVLNPYDLFHLFIYNQVDIINLRKIAVEFRNFNARPTLILRLISRYITSLMQIFFGGVAKKSTQGPAKSPTDTDYTVTFSF